MLRLGVINWFHHVFLEVGSLSSLISEFTCVKHAGEMAPICLAREQAKPDADVARSRTVSDWDQPRSGEVLLHYRLSRRGSLARDRRSSDGSQL